MTIFACTLSLSFFTLRLPLSITVKDFHPFISPYSKWNAKKNYNGIQVYIDTDIKWERESHEEAWKELRNEFPLHLTLEMDSITKWKCLFFLLILLLFRTIGTSSFFLLSFPLFHLLPNSRSPHFLGSETYSSSTAGGNNVHQFLFVPPLKPISLLLDTSFLLFHLIPRKFPFCLIIYSFPLSFFCFFSFPILLEFQNLIEMLIFGTEVKRNTHFLLPFLVIKNTFFLQAFLPLSLSACISLSLISVSLYHSYSDGKSLSLLWNLIRSHSNSSTLSSFHPNEYHFSKWMGGWVILMSMSSLNRSKTRKWQAQVI